VFLEVLSVDVEKVFVNDESFSDIFGLGFGVDDTTEEEEGFN